MWHPDFTIEGQTPEEWVMENESRHSHICAFIQDWSDGKQYFQFRTSGSTGDPKVIELSREVLIHSAQTTLGFLNIANGSEALLAIPPQFIGGTMMLVRAMVGGLNLSICDPQIEAIVQRKSPFDFLALTPHQAHSLLASDTHFFDDVKCVILGGGQVDEKLERSLIQMPTQFWSTYGMTETASHIALRKIDADKQLFQALPGVTFSLTSKGQLVIEAPNWGVQKLETNDLVQLESAHSFKWLGRFDNVINSGGIKLFPEVLEEKLKSFIEGRYFIAGESHEKWGQQVVLYVEGKERALDLSALYGTERPKRTVFVDEFELTPTGKINRRLTQDKANL